MIVEGLSKFEEYGGVKIYEVVRVLELDSANTTRARSSSFVLDYDTITDIASRTAIVVPIKDDELFAFEGVLSAIPHESMVIVVSASTRSPVDRYRHEVEVAKLLHSSTGRPIVVVHQHDEAWATALEGTPGSELLDENNRVRRGKGEGMLLGVIIAAGLGAQFIGFVDSDCYVPGAVHEYVWAYYTGFALRNTDNIMVRIKWPYKGKIAGIQQDIYFRRRGRVSARTNEVLNLSLSLLRGVETDIVVTANSGEHALSTKLALSMQWAGGFAIEPYELVYILENCWLGLREGRCPLKPPSVEILQIETRNPHIHAERGDEHIVDMIAKSLGVVYHSSLASEKVKNRVKAILEAYGYQGEPPRPRVYPSLEGADLRKIVATYFSHSNDALLLK